MDKEDKVEWIKCKNCGYLQHSSHRRCLNCKNQSFKTILAQGHCTLLTYTILNAPPMEFRDRKSYALGVVKFDNGIRALGQITTQEELKIGMKLDTTHIKICDNLDGREVFANVFKPIE